MGNCTQPPEVHFIARNEKETLCGKKINEKDQRVWWVRTSDNKNYKYVNCPTCKRFG